MLFINSNEAYFNLKNPLRFIEVTVKSKVNVLNYLFYIYVYVLIR